MGQPDGAQSNLPASEVGSAALPLSTLPAPMFYSEPLTPALIREVGPLLFKHWDELAKYKDIRLDPDWDVYMKAQSIGALIIYTARIEGELVGYACFFAKSSLHYRQSYEAQSDVIFIDPARRGFGKSFVRWCREQLRARGVKVLRWAVKAAYNWGAMLERDGAELEDLHYVERLDQPQKET